MVANEEPTDPAATLSENIAIYRNLKSLFLQDTPHIYRKRIGYGFSDKNSQFKFRSAFLSVRNSRQFSYQYNKRKNTCWDFGKIIIEKET